MPYCIHCGQQNEEGVRFCTNCGKPIDSAEDQKPEGTSHLSAAPVKKQPMSKKKKIALIAIAAVIGILLIAYVSVDTMLDPMKQVEAMDSALKQGDDKAFMEEFKVPEETIYDSEIFFQYIKLNDWSTIRDNLVAEITSLENNSFADPVTDSSGTEIITVVQKDYLFGLFKKMEFELIPIEVYTEVPFKDMKITVNDHEIKTDKEGSQSLGSYLPGVYDWSYTYTGEWGKVKNSGELSIESNYGSNELEVYLDWNMNSLDIDSDIEDAIVYVDGKSTEKTVGEIETMYPLPNDGSVEIYAVVKDAEGNKIKSNAVTSDSWYAYFYFPESDTSLMEQSDDEELNQETYIEKLDSIEEGLADLDDLYASDDDADILEAEKETYNRWDEILNEIYDLLQEELSSDEAADLEEEQLDWITEKETSASLEASEYDEETMQEITNYKVQAQYTKERCYELVEDYME